MKAAFTLLEVLLAFAVIAVLAALVIPATSQINAYATRVKTVSNLRQIGVAARLYANDHDQQLPGHPAANDGPGGPAPDQWPTLFCAYLSPSDPQVFLDGTDPAAEKLPMAQIISNQTNNTGFIYNGFDDLGADNEPPAKVRLANFDHPSEVVLMSQKAQGATSFFVDLLFQPVGDLLHLLNPAACNGGAQYLYLDGSVRFLKVSEYSNTLWLVDKSITLPPLLPPLPPVVPPLNGPLPTQMNGMLAAQSGIH